MLWLTYCSCSRNFSTYERGRWPDTMSCKTRNTEEVGPLRLRISILKWKQTTFQTSPAGFFQVGLLSEALLYKDNQTLEACAQTALLNASNLAAAQIQQWNHDNSNSNKEFYFWGKAICQRKMAMVGSVLGPPKFMHRHRNGHDNRSLSVDIHSLGIELLTK